MSHDAWSGAYSAFMRWRLKVAEVAGYGNLMEYQGFGGGKSFPDKPLSILLSHSDCEGEIAWKDLKGIADDLASLLPALEIAGEAGGHIGNFKSKTEQMIKGFREAFSRKENIEFY